MIFKYSFIKRLTTLFLIAFVSACATLTEDPKLKWTAKDFYEQASLSLEAGEFQIAIEHLETLEARFPFDPYAKQAQLDVAYSYYKFDEPESALSATDRFLRLHPRDPHIDYIYYLKGLIHFERGRGFLDDWFPRDISKHESATLKKSFQEFSYLINKYPDSKYAGDAHQRMVYLRNMLAKQEINNALFYIEREAWLAAANRAKIVIERYQHSTWSLTALEIMVKAYQQLGLKDLADNAQRVLELNKPNLIKNNITQKQTEHDLGINSGLNTEIGIQTTLLPPQIQS